MNNDTSKIKLKFDVAAFRESVLHACELTSIEYIHMTDVKYASTNFQAGSFKLITGTAVFLYDEVTTSFHSIYILKEFLHN
jgi:hypothetical protein